jgi:hypothetical protein
MGSITAKHDEHDHRAHGHDEQRLQNRGQLQSAALHFFAQLLGGSVAAWWAACRFAHLGARTSPASVGKRRCWQGPEAKGAPSRTSTKRVLQGVARRALGLLRCRPPLAGLSKWARLHRGEHGQGAGKARGVVAAGQAANEWQGCSQAASKRKRTSGWRKACHMNRG